MAAVRGRVHHRVRCARHRANLGSQTGDLRGSLLYLGVLLALYDGAEVVLKPVFGSIADRVGARPVMVAGLLAFAAASAVFVAVDDPSWL